MSIFRSRIHRRRSRVMWTATSCLFETCSLRFCATWSFWTRCLERSNTNCLRTDLFLQQVLSSPTILSIKILFFNAIYLIWIVTFPFLLKGVGHLAQTTIIASPLFHLKLFIVQFDGRINLEFLRRGFRWRKLFWRLMTAAYPGRYSETTE